MDYWRRGMNFCLIFFPNLPLPVSELVSQSYTTVIEKQDELPCGRKKEGNIKRKANKRTKKGKNNITEEAVRKRVSRKKH